MSLKWNEGLVISFLKEYKKYPCLWNPYHMNYYNCRVKNAALRKIIDTLDIPGFTVNDYLQQIKIIREKYKQEQARTIKCIQSQKHYRSPFPWYNIVAEMLMEVINDEEKATLGTETYNIPLGLKSLSTHNINDSQIKGKARTATKTQRLDLCTDATCDIIIRRSKSTKSDKSYDLEFLQCPVCGWESANDDQTVRNMEKPMYKQKGFTPCVNYNRDPTGRTYMICTECNQVTQDDVLYEPEYMKEYVNNSGDFKILQDSSKQVPCPTLANKVTETELIRPAVELIANTKQVVDIGVQCEKKPEKLSKNGSSVSVPIQTQIFKLDPVAANKFHGSIVEACLKIMLSGSSENLKENETSPVFQTPQVVQCIQTESKLKQTQFSSKDTVPKTNTNEAEINTVNYADIGIQNTICVSDVKTQCISLQTDKKEKENCKNYNKSTIHQPKSEEIAVNMIDKVMRGIQSTICISHGNLFSNRTSDRIEIGTNTISAYQLCNVACVTTENVMKLHSDPPILNDKNIPVIRARSTESINHCVEHLINSMKKEKQEYKESCRVDTCPHNLMYLIKEDPTLALLLQQLLFNILISEYEQNTRSRKSSLPNLQTDGKCTIDLTEMMNKIREHTIRILGLDIGDITKNKAKLFYQKFDASTTSREAKGKTISTNTESPTFYASTLTMTSENSSELMSKSTVTKQDKSQQISRHDVELTKEANKKFSNADKENPVFPNDKNINGLSTQLLTRDAKNQRNILLSKHSVCPNKCEQTMQNKISVGTQKRDPILVRVIKCNEIQGIVKSDKETLTVRTGIDVAEKSIGKHVETCGRSTCTSYTINRKSNETNLESALHKKRENIIDNDYRKRSVIFNNYICDKDCKDKANRDWTDVANVNVCFNKSTSKIPSGVKSCKCAINR